MDLTTITVNKFLKALARSRLRCEMSTFNVLITGTKASIG